MCLSEPDHDDLTRICPLCDHPTDEFGVCRNGCAEGYRECADLNREMAEENVAIAHEVLPEYGCGDAERPTTCPTCSSVLTTRMWGTSSHKCPDPFHGGDAS